MCLGPHLRKITSVKRVSHMNLNCISTTTVSKTAMEITDASCSESKVTSSHNRMTTEEGELDDCNVTREKTPERLPRQAAAPLRRACGRKHGIFLSCDKNTQTARGNNKCNLVQQYKSFYLGVHDIKILLD